MTNEKLLDAIGKIDDSLIHNAVNDIFKKKKPVWLKWGVMAACLCLVIAGAVMMLQNGNGRMIISNYASAGSSGSYAEPAPGEIIYTTEVNAARENYKDKNVAYLLKCDIYKADGDVTDEEKNAEYQRLISLGYELYTVEAWTYRGKGEKVYFDVVVGCFTEEQLNSFENNMEYGYIFSFVTNGDGSQISFDEKNLITDFETNQS